MSAPSFLDLAHVALVRRVWEGEVHGSLHEAAARHALPVAEALAVFARAAELDAEDRAAVPPRDPRSPADLIRAALREEGSL